MRKIFKNIFRIFFNSMVLQRAFVRVYPKFLKLMNYGRGEDFRQSGELKVIKYIYTRLVGTKKIILFDVGANIGEYTLALNDFFKEKDHQIFSFEPSTETFKMLTQKTEGIINVIPVNFGLGDKNNRQSLFSASHSSGLTSVYNRRLDHLNIKMDKTEEIDLTTIDSFCVKNGVDHIDFLKIDVEGHELKVLQGAEKMICNGGIRFIQFEFGGCNIDSKTYFQDFYYLLSEKYKIFRIVQNGLIPILNYHETQEIFLTVNYFAELR